MNKLIIIGSGPAGYTAAIYAARANLEPILFEGFYSGAAGGQLMLTTEVENFPGFPEGIQGPQLMDAMRAQAVRFGTKCISKDIVKVNFKSHPFSVETDKEEYFTHSVIIATGAHARRLDVPGTRSGEFWQNGVTACAVCDGAMPMFRNKDLYVIGGGDTAVEEALFLTKFASHVYVVHRRDELRASKIMAEQLMKHPKITILWNRVLKEVKGEAHVTHVVLEDVQSKQHEEKAAGGVFFALGHIPNTEFLKGHLDMDSFGYIKVKPGSTQTNVSGVFACGDVQDPIYRQAISAAGTGCMAALDAERWLVLNGHE